MKSIERKTHVIDAAGKSVGRLASQITGLLRGKNKSSYQNHIDGGDYVKVDNAGQLKLSGKKIDQKFYYRHSGYIGNLKEIPAKRMMEQNPARMIWLAVYGMLPNNKLRRQQMKRLKINR